MGIQTRFCTIVPAITWSRKNTRKNKNPIKSTYIHTHRPQAGSQARTYCIHDTCTHTHTHTFTQTHTHTHTQTLTPYNQTQARTRTRTLAHTLTRTLTFTANHMHSRPYTYTMLHKKI